MRISDCSSDVCSSDLLAHLVNQGAVQIALADHALEAFVTPGVVLAFQHADKAAFSTVRGSIGQGHAYQGQQIGHGVALQVQTYIQRDQRLRSRHRTLQAYSSPPDTALDRKSTRLNSSH